MIGSPSVIGSREYLLNSISEIGEKFTGFLITVKSLTYKLGLSPQRVTGPAQVRAYFLKIALAT